MKKRLVRWSILLIIGFSIGSAIGYVQYQNESDAISISPDDKESASILKKPTSTETSETSSTSKVGGAFSLTDHNGKNVTQEDYADTYKLIFFGFTFCPAVCPTELQKVNIIMHELGDLADKITPIFVTIDPERDDVQTMKEYVSQFHPKLVGLTGSREQIDAIKKAFLVYATKVENDMMDEYMMDHSSFTYLTNEKNKMIAIYPAKDTAAQIADDIKARGL